MQDNQPISNNKPPESNPIEAQIEAQTEPQEAIKTVKHRITHKNKLFINGVARGLSGAEAVKQAGYSPKEARKYAYTLLQKVDISRQVNEERRRIEEKFKITQESLLKETTELQINSKDERIIKDCIRLKAEITGNIKPHENKQTILLVNAHEKAILAQYGLDTGKGA